MDSTNLRFLTFTKNLTLIMKTPGRLFMQGVGGDVLYYEDEVIDYCLGVCLTKTRMEGLLVERTHKEDTKLLETAI